MRNPVKLSRCIILISLKNRMFKTRLKANIKDTKYNKKAADSATKLNIASLMIIAFLNCKIT